jgi:hypothetical protein
LETATPPLPPPIVRRSKCLVIAELVKGEAVKGNQGRPTREGDEGLQG